VKNLPLTLPLLQLPLSFCTHSCMVGEVHPSTLRNSCTSH
jgi:hypothetical protein